MVYGGGGVGREETNAFLCCEICKKRCKQKDVIIYYDDNDKIPWWDGTWKAKIHWFCSNDCKNKYLGR